MSDRIDSTSNGRQDIQFSIRVNEYRFRRQMSFPHGGLDGVGRDHGAGRGGGEELDAVRASIQEFPGDGRSLRRVRNLRERDIHPSHHVGDDPSCR